MGSCLGERFDLGRFQRGIGGVNRNFSLFISSKLIHADDNSLLVFNGLLIFVRGILNFALYPTNLDGGQHTAKAVDLLEVLGYLPLDLSGLRLAGLGSN